MKQTDTNRNQLAKISLYPETLKKIERTLPEGMSITKYINQLLMEE
tara:strand:- start:457 stop:594 length:138 start_codon:yes stop_codon:yes gene_type:complete